MKVSEIINALRVEVSEDGHILLDRLEKELHGQLWPGQVIDQAVEVFGPSLYNEKSRNRKTLDKLVRLALTTWDRRYGPLNLDQDKYASSVLCAAIASGAQAARESNAETAMPFVILRLKACVNHEVVDRGFKRRSGIVDVRDDLKQAFG